VCVNFFVFVNVCMHLCVSVCYVSVCVHMCICAGVGVSISLTLCVNVYVCICTSKLCMCVLCVRCVGMCVSILSLFVRMGVSPYLSLCVFVCRLQLYELD